MLKPVTVKNVQVLVPRERIDDFCKRWQVATLALFGSVLRADFSLDSDIDVLVSFDRNARWTLFDLVTMQEELEQIFGRRVDLVEQHRREERELYPPQKYLEQRRDNLCSVMTFLL